MRIGHTFECCWAEGGGFKGQQLITPGNSQPSNGSSGRDSRKKKDTKVAILIAQDCAAVAEHNHTHPSEWVVDSGTSSHICLNCNWFTSYSTLDPPCLIILGDKCVIHAIGQGQIDIAIQDSPDEWHATVQDVLHCPQIGTNLLSISHLTDVNIEVQFIKKQCLILNSNQDCIGVAH